MEYEIRGGSFPIVICTLQEGETIKNETGAMSFMTSGMKMETNTGGGLLKGLGRALSGDSLFLNFFTAESGTQLKLKYSLKTNLEQEYSVVKDLSFKSSLEKELYSWKLMGK